jgi:hypothetical protein
VEVDRVGPEIVSAAKHDTDFLKWLSKHSIVPSSDEEWIRQYAQWAK